MKTNLYATILFVFLVSTAIAQNMRIIDSNEYDQLKKTNQLPEKFLLKKTEGGQTVIMPRIQPSASSTLSNATCNCLLPLDTTYSVVPFTNGIAPDYRNDDMNSPAINLPFSFCLFGLTMNSVYINNNGNISFVTPYNTFTANGFPDATHAMIAPFWGDVDTRDTLSGLVYYKVTPTALIVKWEHVGYYGLHTDKLNTFQLIITDGNDPLISVGNNTAICFGDMQWTTGDASQGINGFGGIPATVGANRGDGINYIQFGRFDQPGYGYDGPFLANDSVDWLDSSSFVFNLCPANISPIPFDCNNDTVYLRVGDSTDIDITFIAPETGQTTTININAGALINLTTLSNTSGNMARYRGRLVADNANLGMNAFSVTATDNGTPAQSTTVNRVFHIDQATGIQQNNSSPSISFSPNPFTDQTTLTIAGFNRKNITLIISDVIGREVLRANDVQASLTIEKGNLSKGIYTYHITDGNSLNETGKIVIQ